MHRLPLLAAAGMRRCAGRTGGGRRRRLAGVPARSPALLVEPREGDHAGQRRRPAPGVALGAPGRRRQARAAAPGEPGRGRRPRLHRLEHRHVLRASRGHRRRGVEAPAGRQHQADLRRAGDHGDGHRGAGSGLGRRTVYVSGARSLYALDAATGAVRWQTRIGPAGDPTVNDYYNWSSPTVVAGHIYLGISSFCDDPLVRCGRDRDRPALRCGRAHVVQRSRGSIGGSVWTSVAASASRREPVGGDGQRVRPHRQRLPGRQPDRRLAVHGAAVRLARPARRVAGARRGGQRARLGLRILADAVRRRRAARAARRRLQQERRLLRARPHGAVRRAAVVGTRSAPARRPAPACRPRVWDAGGRRLFAASNGTTIGGASYPGSLRRVDPATGAYVWQLGLPCTVLGSPSGDAGGVIAVVTRGSCTAPAADALLPGRGGHRPGAGHASRRPA